VRESSAVAAAGWRRDQVRYYSWSGQSIASRTVTALSWTLSDEQGSGMAMDVASFKLIPGIRALRAAQGGKSVGPVKSWMGLTGGDRWPGAEAHRPGRYRLSTAAGSALIDDLIRRQETMMARSTSPGENQWTARDRAIVVLIAVVLFAIGLLMTVGGIVFKTSDAGKAERLRSDGVAATATLAEFRYANKSKKANVELWYLHEGRQYHKRINCPEQEACNPEVQPTMGVRIDPAQPAEFVADNGVTDDSRSFFNYWSVVIVGVFVTLAGGLAAWVRLNIGRSVSREPRWA
jgi:hypothetical protein